MFLLMILIFVIGYTVIALEHPLKINKTATALLLGVTLWVCAMIGGESILIDKTSMDAYLTSHPGSGFSDWLAKYQLIHSLGEVAEIIFFLLGAMTIVEIIDTNGGFSIITNRIKSTNKVRLLWVLSILTFFMSAVLDNLTTSIVMVALLRKLIDDQHDRWFFAGMVILAANAGGVWSPIGDVTTIMLWIGGKISASNIISADFLPSAISIIIPLIILSFKLKGDVQRPQLLQEDHTYDQKAWQSTLFLCLGVSCLIFVPIFKTITHLPPYLGMLSGLSILWMTSELVHRFDKGGTHERFMMSNIIGRVDISSILFFLGILLAVNALSAVGHLGLLANNLDAIPLEEPSKYYVIGSIIGVLSSVVDNVPLVAATMGMYDFPLNHYFWTFIAYCAGTGGSLLIIGSAAGVAVMGMEKIDFIWYLKKISWLALIGYIAGVVCFIVQELIYVM